MIQLCNRFLRVPYLGDRSLLLIWCVHALVVGHLQCLQGVDLAFDPVRNVHEWVLEIGSQSLYFLLKVVVARPRDQPHVRQLTDLSRFFLLSFFVLLQEL